MDGRARIDLVVPMPRTVERMPGAFALSGPVELRPPPGFVSPALERLRAELARRVELASASRSIELVLDGRSGHPREGYSLVIDSGCVRVVASKGVGLNHGLRTLTQLLRAEETALPSLAIEDAPAFERRGVLLDVSRDRVPRMDYLFRLVDQLADWKLNELQLYCEHAFAYRDHETVWRGVDPFTHDEIRALDHHCAAQGIELVANQQSFGHMHHWLKHDRYRHLAEVPEGIVHPFLGAGETQPEPFSLCPTDPRSLDFLAGLYDELLPSFTSRDFNVGLDETIDLGPGRSAAVIGEKGVGRVYLDFLKSVHGLVCAREKRMQFWADILLHHAELVREVPRDAVALLWGYEADHPFEEQTRTLAEAGLPFYVCPGTSSWLSIGGRLDNMLANVKSASRWGAKRGARGLLITDWGDRGHLQPPSASWPAFLVAAELAWNPAAERRLPNGRSVTHALKHVSSDFDWRWSILGMVPSACGLGVRNASAVSILLTKFDHPFPPPELARVAVESLDAARDVIAPLSSGHETSGLSEREARWATKLMTFACDLGLARLEVGDGRPLASLAQPTRARLAGDLSPLISEHRTLWLERSRPGGLDRSARWLERILAALTAR